MAKDPNFNRSLNALLGIPDRTWVSQARCNTPSAPETNFFFPENSDVEGLAAAVEFCQPCPVKDECLEYCTLYIDKGIPSRQLWGVYGGKTPQERAILRKLNKGKTK